VHSKVATPSSSREQQGDKKEAKVKNLTWADYDPIHAQLVRDCFHHRYDSETKATEIHRDPYRKYSKYNIQTIRNKLKYVRLLVKTFHHFGIWLDENPEFLKMCDLSAFPQETEMEGREEEYKKWEERYPNGYDRILSLCKIDDMNKKAIEDIKDRTQISPDGGFSFQLDVPDTQHSYQRLKVEFKGSPSSSSSPPSKVSISRKSGVDCDQGVLSDAFASLSITTGKMKA